MGSSARNALATPEVARENTWACWRLVLGHTARNSLKTLPSMLRVMWSTWTPRRLSSPRQRSAWPPAKLRRRLALARPSHQNEQGLMRPDSRPHCTIRPTAARLKGLSGWRRLCSRCSRALRRQRISSRMANTRSASAGVHCLPRCVSGRLLRGAKPRIPSLSKWPRQSQQVLRAKPSRASDALSVNPCPRARSTPCSSSKRRAASGWSPRSTRTLRK